MCPLHSTEPCRDQVSPKIRMQGKGEEDLEQIRGFMPQKFQFIKSVCDGKHFILLGLQVEGVTKQQWYDCKGKNGINHGVRDAGREEAKGAHETENE